MRVGIHRIDARLRAPVFSAHGSVTERALLLLELGARDGIVGWGEAAPLEAYDGVSAAAVLAALEDCRELLQDADGAEHAQLIAACFERAVLPQAVAAIDLALWDMAGHRAGEPVWRLLGAAEPAAVQVNAAIGAGDRAGAAAQAGAALEAGFACVKVKVGIGDDAGRLAAVRAVCGRQAAIRLDANGAWSPEEAVASLRALEPVGIELCEEPVHGLPEVRRVAAASSVPISIDESAALPGALESRCCDAVCLKVSRCGGISGVLHAAARARSVGYECYLASTFDGPLGIAAALHCAAALHLERPSGLATLALFDGRDDPLAPQGGSMVVPRDPGLGSVLLPWYGLGS